MESKTLFQKRKCATQKHRRCNDTLARHLTAARTSVADSAKFFFESQDACLGGGTLKGVAPGSFARAFQRVRIATIAAVSVILAFGHNTFVHEHTQCPS
jgi:hypothetical protein